MSRVWRRLEDQTKRFSHFLNVTFTLIVVIFILVILQSHVLVRCHVRNSSKESGRMQVTWRRIRWILIFEL